MAEPLQNLSLDQLKNILKRTFLQEPLSKAGLESFIRRGGEVSPYQSMLGRSSAIDYARQVLPADLDNTNWYQKLKNQLPGGDLQSTPGIRRRVANQIGQIPLGGYHPAELEGMQHERDHIDPWSDEESVANKRKFLDASQVTSNAGIDTPIKGRPAARAAQAAGVIGRDIATDGLRNIWWFLNAPQAATQIAALQGVHKSGMRATESRRPLIGKGALRLAATAPAVVAMSTAIGNIGRPAGYKAIIPSKEDPRETDSPVAELLSRYFLGRSGRLLPYNELVKERPDVDKGEYQRYKAYQFNKQTDLNPLDGDFNVLGALRGTTEGIHGPEVNFMGKSIPVLTGILPTAAAIAGIRRGVSTAGRRMKAKGDIDNVLKIEEQLKEVMQARPEKGGETRKLVAIDSLKAKLDEAQDENSIKALKQALLYGSGYTTAGALTGQALESIRRDMGRED
jgi:hypothetical protein